METTIFSTPVILRHRYNGPILPRVSGIAVGHGMLLSFKGDSWLTILSAALVCALLAYRTERWLRREWAGSLDWYIVLVLACVLVIGLPFFLLAGRRAWRARFLGNAQLLVRPWPLRCGDEVTLSFRRRLRKDVELTRMDACLECAETIEISNIRGRPTRYATCGRVALETSKPRTSGGQITCEWKGRLPTDLPPSFLIRNNGVIWTMNVLLVFEGVKTAPSSFPLLVLPERVA
ncbi:MAG: hypothetical protein M3041_14470 [Acidobacteriota bacterium]|nr:hypothetical protein [Acidobacteriota bacterium]